ncbi:LuxR family transcriptional regulator [Actinomycetes bacterium KLBMP 9797]
MRRTMTGGPVLFGRSRELSVIDTLLTSARSGNGGALVISGGPGTGKSALLDHAREVAAMRTLSATGVESESHLPFAAAHMLLRATFGHVGALPSPQADGIRAAFGLGPPTSGDRSLAGLAGLALMTAFAGGEPLLCLVDDAHWLDQASADLLLFLLRRLGVEGVALIVATRESESAFLAPGLPELRLGGLAAADAARLLSAAVGELPAGVCDRVSAEAGGNPLALLEMAAQLSPEQRAGRITPLPLYVAAGTHSAGRSRAVFGNRIRRLPDRTQTLLLVAAADGTGDMSTLLRAAHRLGATLPDLAAAEQDGLVEVIGSALVFRHPLAGTAVYRCTPAARRKAAHEALAAAYTDAAHADRRAWHRAAAALEPDAGVAAELATAARVAAVRGGHAEASAAYERAAELTADPGTRAGLLAAAAEAARHAGRMGHVITLTGRAEGLADEPALLAHLAHLRADAEFELVSPHQAGLTLLAGAALVASRDPAAALPLLMEAAWRAWFAGDGAHAVDVLRGLERLAVPPETRADPHLRVAVDLARRTAGDPSEGLGAVRAALRDPSGGHDPAVNALLCVFAGADATGARLAAALVAELRAGGKTGRLPIALAALAAAELFRGEHLDAAAAATECVRLAVETGQPRRAALGTAVLALLAALGGAEERCALLAGDLARHGQSLGIGPIAALGTWAGGLLDLGLGRYAAALHRLERLPLDAFVPFLSAWAAPDLVEAAFRAGRRECAQEPLARFAAWADEIQLPWADAVLLRCRALATEGPAAEEHYRSAVTLHAQGGRPFERARTELAFGEWLRRGRRRAEARPHLRAAQQIFERMAAHPWADRVRAELAATGEAPEATPDDPPAVPGLTPQESQVVRLAARRLTNRDIAARLFLSRRTVEYHLYRAYRKLGVSARGDLAHAMIKASLK